MIAYTLRDGQLFVGDASAPTAFPLRVEEVVAFDEILVVCLTPTSQIANNVYGVDAQGEIVWQVAEFPANPLRDTYLGIKKKSDTVVAGAFSMGRMIYIVARTGEILEREPPP